MGLPEEVVAEVLEGLEGDSMSETAIRGTSRGAFEASERVMRRRLRREFGERGVRVTELMDGGTLNWRRRYVVLSQEWHFFDTDDIVDGRREDVKEVRARDLRQLHELARNGVWKRVMNGYYGGPNLFSSNVVHMHLAHRAVLFPGRYLVTLDLKVGNLTTLIPIRFTVAGVGQPDLLVPLRRNFPNADIRAIGVSAADMYGRYMDNDNFQLCIGLIEVLGDDPQTVELEVEEVGMSVLRNILFNAVYYQRVRSASIAEENGWIFRQHMVSPPINRHAYKSLHKIKSEYLDM